MAQWPIPPNLHSKIEGGPVCFCKDHSIGSKDGRIPRYSDSHACVRCISSLTEGRLSLDIHEIEKKHRRRFLEFWSFVEIGTADECWPWHGPTHSRSRSTYFSMPRHWGGRQYSAQRCAVWFSWGDVGRLPIKAVCGNNDCCNPLHLRVKGVPHFFNHRHLHAINLEFNSRKLMEDTQRFLETTRDKDPKRFEKIEKDNKIWIDFRMNASGPLDTKTLINANLIQNDEF